MALLKKPFGRFNKNSKGSIMVEFAIITPILATLILGAIDFSFDFWQRTNLANTVFFIGDQMTRSNNIEGFETSSADEEMARATIASLDPFDQNCRFLISAVVGDDATPADDPDPTTVAQTTSIVWQRDVLKTHSASIDASIQSKMTTKVGAVGAEVVLPDLFNVAAFTLNEGQVIMITEGWCAPSAMLGVFMDTDNPQYDRAVYAFRTADGPLNGTWPGATSGVSYEPAP